MKVRCDYTIRLTEQFRRAINHRLGLKGVANREECKAFLRMYGTSTTFKKGKGVPLVRKP